MPSRRPRADWDEDELVEQFESMNVRRDSRKPFPKDPEDPCFLISNERVRQKYGLKGDPSIDIDHIVEAHRAGARGWNAEVQVNKELAPRHLNRRWGALYKQGRDDEVEQEKREYYGDERYNEAVRGVRKCNCRYK